MPLPLDDSGFVGLVADCLPELTYHHQHVESGNAHRHTWHDARSGERTVLVIRASGQHTITQSRSGCYDALLDLERLWRDSAPEPEDATRPAAVPNVVGQPLNDVPSVPGLEHSAFPGVIAAELPGVTHYRRMLPSSHPHADEHVVVHPVSASVARLVVRWNPENGGVRTQVADAGPRRLYEEVLALGERWERSGRPVGAS